MPVLSHHPHRRRPGRSLMEPLIAALSLAPLALAAAWLWPGRFPLSFLAALAAGLGAALALGRGRMARPAAGWCVYEALVIVLLMPSGVPWFIPGLILAAVVLARTLIADRDFLPPVNALALALGAAVLFTAPGAFGLSFGTPDLIWGVTRGNFAFLTGWTPLLASLLLTTALRARAFKWHLSAWFLIAAGLAGAAGAMASAAGVPPGWEPVPAYAAVFAAITLVSDPRSTPLAARGQAAAGIAAGTVFALFALRGMPYQGMVFSALAANLLTPLLDYVLARSPAR
jgi:Na+-translocating ferredoxin:NAD+ oxidoreductase RnfD subunit